MHWQGPSDRTYSLGTDMTMVGMAIMFTGFGERNCSTELAGGVTRISGGKGLENEA